MNKTLLKLLFFLGLQCLSSGVLHAGAPLKVNFQGRLEESGEPVEGQRSFVFKIYNAASGGALVWTSQTENASVAGGVFSVVLETGNPVNLSTSVFTGARYIEVSVGGVALSPRQEMLSVPYALTAQALSSDARVSPASLDAGPLGANVMVSSIAAGAVHSNALTDSAVTFFKMSANGCAANEIIKRNAGNTAWICAPDAGAGSGITLAAPSPDNDVSINDSIYINDTGGGNLVRLQTAGVDKFVVDGTGLLLTGSIGAARIASGSLGTNVISSSVALNSVHDGAIISMSSSKLVGALPAISGAALTNVNSAQFAAVAADTTTIKIQINSVAVSTGALYGKFTQVATDTTTLKASIDALSAGGDFTQVAAATTSLRSAINAVAVDTGTLYGKFAQVATDTTTLKTGINAVAVDTGTLYGRFSQVAIATTTLKADIDALSAGDFTQVAADTTTLRAAINAVAVDTGTLYGKFTQVAIDTTTLKADINALSVGNFTQVAIDTTTL
ncbi:MAG TPA: hypothetical protein DCS63_01225, partial [Elusimicrobia bacterium]|nr:hypothetical protein [Elusimicrobiota bacterium]